MSRMSDFASGLKKGFKDFGQLIAVLINSALLAIVYIIGVGVTSIIAKLSHKHFLETKTESKAKTYWSDLKLKKKPLDEYYRQF